MRSIEHLLRMQEIMRGEFSRKYCLHSDAPKDCTSSVASAHSIQKALIKRLLAIDGHVLQIRPQIDHARMALRIDSERVGVNKASTFYGFCAHHDNSVFAPLEQHPFAFQDQQIALMAYRCAARERYMKDSELDSTRKMMNYASLLPDIANYSQMRMTAEAVILGQNLGLSIARASFDKFSLLISDHSNLHFFAVEFEKPPPYLCSVLFLPEFDFSGTQLQNILIQGSPAAITFTAWAVDSRSAAVFAWHRNDDSICIPFIDSLRMTPKVRWSDQILMMAMEHSDNVFYRPDWWDGLPCDAQASLKKRVVAGVPGQERKAHCLVDDGLQIVNDCVRQEYLNY